MRRHPASASRRRIEKATAELADILAAHDDEHGEAEPLRFARTGVGSLRAAEPGTGTDTAGGDISPAEHRARIENISMAALTRRDVSRAELVARLIEREVDPVDADAEADRLERVGLIDDVAFAERLVERLRRRKGIAGAALRAELRARKLADDAIEQALAAVDRDDDRAFAIELAEKRARSLARLDRDVAERRLSAFLMRKGYSGSIVRDAVAAALGPASRGTVRFRAED